MIHRAAALPRKETASTEPAKHAVGEKTHAVTDSFNSRAFSPRCIVIYYDERECACGYVSVFGIQCSLLQTEFNLLNLVSFHICILISILFWYFNRSRC